MRINLRNSFRVLLIAIVAVSFQNCTKTDVGFDNKQVLNQSLFAAGNNGTGYTGKIAFVEKAKNGLCSATSDVLQQIDVLFLNSVAKQAEQVVKDCAPIQPIELQINVDLTVAPDLGSITYQSQPMPAVGPVPDQSFIVCSDGKMSLVIRMLDAVGVRATGFLKTELRSYEVVGSSNGQTWFFNATPPSGPVPQPVPPELQYLEVWSTELLGDVVYKTTLINGYYTGVLTCTRPQ